MSVNIGDEFSCPTNGYAVKVIGLNGTLVEVETTKAGSSYTLGSVWSVYATDSCFTSGYWVPIVKQQAATLAVKVGDQFDCPRLGYRIEVIATNSNGYADVRVVRSTNSAIPVGTIASNFDIQDNLNKGYYVPVSSQCAATSSKDQVGALNVAAMARAIIPTHCHRCQSPNEYGALANRGNNFVCGMCRSYE